MVFMLRLFVVIAVTMTTSVALADIPPPNTSGCRSKKAGDACQTDSKQDGICKTHKCSRINYTPDGPRGSVSYDCLKCEAQASPPPDPSKKQEEPVDPAPKKTSTEKKNCSGGDPGSFALALLTLLAGAVFSRRVS